MSHTGAWSQPFPELVVFLRSSLKGPVTQQSLANRRRALKMDPLRHLTTREAVTIQKSYQYL